MLNTLDDLEALMFDIEGGREPYGYYCPHCKKVCEYRYGDYKRRREVIECSHCKKDITHYDLVVFTDEDDLQQWLEDILNNGEELPLNIMVKTEKDLDQYGYDELIKVEYWDWKK